MDRLDGVILYILQRSKKLGKKDLSKFELFKYIYLLQVESYRYSGSPFFSNENVAFVRDKNGPISKNVYDALRRMDGEYITIDERQTDGYSYSRHCITINRDIDHSEFPLDESERLFINSILNSYSKLSMKQLKEVVYNTEPMVDMQQREKSERVDLLKGYQLNFNSVPLDEDVMELMEDNQNGAEI